VPDQCPTFREFGLFSDEVFSSSDLNRRSAEVLNRARTNPVTIARNNEQFALLRREQAASLVKGLAQLVEVVQLAQGALELGKNRPESVLAVVSWIKAFDEEDRLTLLTDVFAACSRAAANDDWEAVGDVIHQWRESAVAIQSGVLREAFASEEDEQPLADPDVITATPDHESRNTSGNAVEA
jgi:hypothetical protein